ncbi:MAG: hypothetical protein MI725_09550 [Pirellulales bacterium]|nr:hypothetical protein [Pirellulales bacterium]
MSNEDEDVIQSQPATKSVVRKRLMKIALFILLLVILELILLCGPWAKKLDVSGIVLDTQTNEPVADAKVIVSAWNHGMFDSNPRKFLTRTNELGRFQLNKKLDFRIAEIDIEAIAPDNRYGSHSVDLWLRIPLDGYSSNPKVNHVFYNAGRGSYTIRLMAPRDRDKKKAWKQYESFSGMWSGEINE